MQLNYRHGFHAGNVADVFKHTMLLLLLEAMQKKDKPFLYLDTHAGRGQYDLLASEGEATGEWRDGIARLQDWPDAPAIVQTLLDDIRQLNRHRGQTALRYYPGSPWLAMQHLREQDRAVFCELQQTEYKTLQQYLAPFIRAEVEQRDGYQALKALLPPVEKRALVLIDPPFETEKDSWSALVKSLQEAHRRFATGVYTIWYPVKAQSEARRFHRLLKDSGIRRIAYAELTTFEDVANVGLNGSGMIIVNPPYQLDQQLAEVMPAMWRRLSERGAGKFEQGVIVGE
ncbi:23S rRNA (adenine(2030)-N(6))-methyltransferase RlmJ [Permianibacter aggregans]|uniref:Ribosomal RNA large subunit methyltransferase J n=1 Tax=Permianibacter aggregans TaxID=1510150 RepID=A0A4R6URZ4_9GAMM|nr:23S rRNA (adenine(2030)-N(6))-methyltransferase RlmJ [Permianibacter aggregans]QGX40790.1 23S rRNA (adenine(2030)-N(6))-methyltransferase RlmJ [Permianibacter aggregans]TDQ48393.1 23S rRNA (adenine2030-N6)-methyltransferase [Permianibacter aggregans]